MVQVQCKCSYSYSYSQAMRPAGTKPCEVAPVLPVLRLVPVLRRPSVRRTLAPWP
ncbi:hypothetical protein GCM10010211_64690 [Streptomyces albospinus]|uniref:Uncharacterized protein n=1 Tax=Streptomyces albospinus TaxID=285515 RepID=A0ABQ2VIK9_9ACTN|nr:hypothetical protein GCM10010211_64690 [Streptomyces albospinus]